MPDGQAGFPDLRARRKPRPKQIVAELAAGHRLRDRRRAAIRRRGDQVREVGASPASVLRSTTSTTRRSRPRPRRFRWAEASAPIAGKGGLLRVPRRSDDLENMLPLLETEYVRKTVTRSAAFLSQEMQPANPLKINPRVCQGGAGPHERHRHRPGAGRSTSRAADRRTMLTDPQRRPVPRRRVGSRSRDWSTTRGWTGCARSPTSSSRRAATLTESNVIFDLDAGHSAAEPRLRRLSSPTDLHETYWEFASQSVIVDVAVDLLGPEPQVPPLEAELQGCRVAARRSSGTRTSSSGPTRTTTCSRSACSSRTSSREWARWASSPAATTARCSTSTTATRWVGALARRRRRTERSRARPSIPSVRPDRSRCTTAAPCTGRLRTRRHRARPLLLQTYAAADAFSYTDLVRRSPHGEELIRGEPRSLGPPRPAPVPRSRRPARTGRSSPRSNARTDADDAAGRRSPTV